MTTAKPLTRNQQAVLTELQTADKAMSALDILDQLRHSGLRAPQQVYRALTSLIKYGRVHKLESLNAFVACTACHDEAHVHDDPIFLICRSCKTVTEAHSPSLKKSCVGFALDHNFDSDLERIEIQGFCSDCANA